VKPVKFVFRKLVGEGSDFFGALVPLSAEKFVWRRSKWCFGYLGHGKVQGEGIKEWLDSPFYKKRSLYGNHFGE
jgi:hypothetical protein